MKKAFFGWWTLLVLPYAILSVASEAKVAFQSDFITLDATAGTAYQQSLRDLLSDSGTGGQLEFKIVLGDPPTWLTVDTQAETMFSKNQTEGPSGNNVGVYPSFQLGVREIGVDGGATTNITMRVFPGWKNNISELDLGVTDEGTKLERDIFQEVVGPTTGLTFSATGLQSWQSIVGDGILTGVPSRNDVGSYSGITITVTHTASSLTNSITAFGEVRAVATPPKWIATQLPDAFEKSEYNESAAPLVSKPDPDASAYVFELISGPVWLQMNSTGSLFGTPNSEDIGSHSVLARVSTVIFGQTYEDTTTLSIVVKNVNESPVWKSNPVVLPPAQSGVAYQQSLAGSVTDPDGDKLTFTKVQGPAWADVTPEGLLRGTPGKNDGAKDPGKLNQFIVEVTDGEYRPRATIQVTVLRPNDPPFWLNNPTVLKPNAKEDSAYTHNLGQYVQDPDGDAITFTLLSGPSWATVTAQGVLRGTPIHGDEGFNEFEILIADSISGSNKAKVHLTVDPTNHKPYWTLDPIQFAVNEDAALSKNISQWAKDDDGDKLSFRVVLGPQWAQLATDGTFTGTAGKDQLGDNTFTVEVSDGNLTAQARVIITVNHVNHKPTWIQDPIKLPSANEREFYEKSIAEFATDIDDGDTLTFSKVPGSGSNWASVSPDGRVSGTPGRDDIGLNTFKVRVIDQGNLFSIASVQINVTQINIAPIWTQNPLSLTDAREDFGYDFDVTDYAFDEDGDPIRFEKLEGPGWLKVASNGKLSGTPEKTDVGSFTAKLRVLDDKGAFNDVVAEGRVVETNHAPEVNLENLVFEVKEREERRINLNDPQYVKDIDGDNLVFTAIGFEDWLTLSPRGELVLKPTHANLGEHVFQFEVFDGEFNPEGTIRIKVLRDARPPVWIENPIQVVAGIDDPFDGTLANKAKDLDGLPITFSKVDGPAWLTVASDGTLSGTPKAADFGVNEFKVRASNEFAGADAVLRVDVMYINHPPYWTENPLVLKPAAVNKNYVQSLAEFAKDPDGDALTFSKTEGPRWAFVTSSGTIIGTPASTDKGENTFIVRVQDEEGLSAEVEVKINVKDSNNPPLWNQDPINLGKLPLDKPINIDLKQFVTDPDGDQLLFRKVNGPNWMVLDSNGNLTGTPNFLGDFTAVFEVNDTQAFVQVAAFGSVVEGGSDNKPPVWTEDPIDFGNVKAGQPFTFDLASKAMDPDGDALSFKLINGPGWMKVAADGKLTGSPLKGDIGSFVAVFEVSDNQAQARAGGLGKVVDDGGGPNQPPKWKEDPIDLGTLPSNRPFTFNLAVFVEDPDGDRITFRLENGPTWLSLSEDGELSGVPTDNDLGSFVGIFVASDGKAEAKAGGLGKVVEGGDNNPPKWLQDPIDLGEVPIDVEFTFNLANFAQDPDGDRLTFTLKSGPSWLELSPEGTLSGTPSLDDLGAFVAIFEVTDGLAKAEAGGLGKVVEEGGDNKPPVWEPEALNFIVTERQVLELNIDDPKYISDPEGDALSFSIDTTPLPKWVTLANNGDLQIAPVYPHIGDFTFPVVAQDADGNKSQTTMKIRVLPDPREPIWLEDPIRMTAEAQVAFVNTLIDKAKDLDGRPVTFSKSAGSGWLKVSSDGALSGTPALSDVGENTFQVTVTNEAGLSANATLIITVTGDAEIVDQDVVDSAVPGARSENLWVIDSSKFCNEMVNQMRKHIHIYFDALDAAQIHHTGIYLSSDAHRWDGTPIRGEDDSLLFGWQNNNVAADWDDRSRKGWSMNWYNSPIWSMFRFYQKLSGMGEIFKKGFFDDKVPMDVLIATRQADHYKKLAKDSAQAGWSPNNFAQVFTDLHHTGEKSFRISAFAPDCPSNAFNGSAVESGDARGELVSKWHTDEDGPVEGGLPPENAYRPLVSYTGGQYYTWCEDKTEDVMRDYAKRVIRRAYINARSKIALSKTPIDATSIRVELNGTPIAANKWSYDAASNSVLIKWHLFDLDQIPAGAKVTIRYRAAGKN